MANPLQREPELVVTPCLSSAKGKMRIWIFDPLDIGILVGLLNFGKEVTSFRNALLAALVYGLVIAFYKHGKPDGYLVHLVRFHLRPKGLKPSKRRRAVRYFDPAEIVYTDSQLQSLRATPGAPTATALNLAPIS